MTPAEKARAVLEHYQFDSKGIARDDVLNVCMEIDDQLDAPAEKIVAIQIAADAAA